MAGWRRCCGAYQNTPTPLHISAGKVISRQRCRLRIVKDRQGQLCNRLWGYAPLIARALADGSPLVVLYFGGYTSLFENLRRYEHIRFIPYDHVLYRWPSQFILRSLARTPDRWRRRLGIYWESEPGHHVEDDRGGIELVDAWPPLRLGEEVRRYAPAIRELFAPASDIVRAVDHQLRQLRRTYDVIIGVHLRRGDYAEWQDGRYYFTDATYARVMHELQSQLPGRRTAFLLCSNEAVDPATFGDLPGHVLTHPATMHDLYALSRCDYIWGPPSSYSMWASFYGQVPHAVLLGSEDSLDIAAFSVVVEKDYYAHRRMFPPIF